MKRKTTLSIDALINLILAIILLLFSPEMADFFGLPSVNNNFYPNILGAVFLGITIALIIEAFRNPSNNSKVGLGMVGAACINLSGGFVLLLWLVFGDMKLPLKGSILLWALDLTLILISTIELFSLFKKK